MYNFCVQQIEKFAKEHNNETFYGFAIDSNMLCLNSEEEAEKTLTEYIKKWEYRNRELNSYDEMTDEDHRTEEFMINAMSKIGKLDKDNKDDCLTFINEMRASGREEGCKYKTEEGTFDLKMNTGDWAYQGFAELSEENGFDNDLYQKHYDKAAMSENGHAPHTKYAKAMNKLINELVENNAFKSIKKSVDFKAFMTDHNY
jgi:hypothetical protein